MEFFIFVFSLLICSITYTQQKIELKRTKRWNNNGGMNNNGDMSNMFRGTAGVDYPDLKTIPTTNFRCDDQLYEGGLYADVETQCQIYHVCHDGRKDSFMCGKGTIFNQEILACDYWYSTECEKAPLFYHVNSQIGNSGSSWVPQPGNNRHDNPSNFEDVNYRSNNPDTSLNTGGNNGSPAGEGTNGQGTNKEDCCCQKYSFKTPWDFPSS